MALVVKDRVRESTTTTGTGTITLGGAVTGFQSFSVIGDGNTTHYAVVSGNDWEVGVGTYTASGATLSRDTILESSNAGAAITLAGTSNVFCTYPAEKSLNQDDIGTLLQAYDADTAKYDDVTANFTGTLQVSGTAVVKVGDNISTLTNDSGYITGNETITLSGDVTGSGTTAITATVANDSHSHTTSTLSGNVSAFTNDSGYITGNQTITLSGDASGSGTTAITVTVADDSHNHIISNVDGLQTALDGKQPLDADLTAIAALANTNGNFIVGNGTAWVAESGATARTSLGLGSLATLSSVSAPTITDNSVGAAELNVSGDGTSGQYLASDGDGTMTWTSLPSGGFSNIEVFTSSGTWTNPGNVSKVKVTVQGGGGGAGGDGPSFGGGTGSGGGGGGAAIEVISFPTATNVPVTRGAGGAINGANSNGSTGGTSSFGAYVSATGGAGGTRQGAGGLGGSGSGGNLNMVGADGSNGSPQGFEHSRQGGPSFLGGGGRGANNPTSTPAGAGNNYGGGGGGYIQNLAGGAGAAGVVIVEY
jgi:hypothetical protein